MPRNFTFCIWLLLFVLLSIPFSLLAQDTTNTPAVIESPTIEFNATVETTTVEAPTLEVTQVIVPSETATVSEGQVGESTEAVLPTTEATGEATSEQTEAVQPEVTNIATEVAPLLPEPTLTPILSEAFHSQDISRWNVGAGWGLVPQQPGFALQVTNTNTTVSSNVTVYDHVAVEMLVQSETGTFNLYLRQNGTESYRLSLYPDGRVDLYHTSTLLSTTTVAPAARNQWRHVRFSAMNDTLRAAIDNVEVIALRDATPLLTAGQIAFNATFPEQPGNSGQRRNRLLVDNIRFWIPANQVEQPTVVTATPLPDDSFTVTLPPDSIPNQFVISFTSESSQQERQAYLGQLGGRKLRDIPQLRAAIVELPAQAVEHRFRHSRVLRTIQPNYRVAVLSNDPLYSQQWGLGVINAPAAWLALPVGTPMMTVAVIDSGICAAHPDLQGRILAGWDFVENDATPQDDLGHGCGVAGIIAANADNSLGIAGAAPNAQIMPLRVLNSTGMGTYADVAAAIIYAVDNGASVINLSLGGSFPATVLEDAVNYAAAHGVVMVAAAGNTGGAVLYPAKYAPVIAVASIDPNLQMSSFSSRGPEIDLLAPGSGIMTTTKDGGYASLSGTSFAAPHVAAAAVLQIALGGNLTLNGGIMSVSGTGTTATPTPTLTATPTLTPEVTTSPELVDEFINPVPNIVVRHIEDFDDGVIDPEFWTANGNYAFVPSEDGQALQLAGGELPLVNAGNAIDNFALSVDVWMNTETFQIEFRRSVEGSYKATFAPTGEVQLYRGTELLQTGNIAPVTTPAWYTVQVAAFWDGLYININGVNVIALSDLELLVDGSIGIGSTGNEPILIDNLVWRTIEMPVTNSEQGSVVQQFIVEVNAANATELVQRISEANTACSPTSNTTIINLTGTSYIFSAYLPNNFLNGENALPIIECTIIINGNGNTIERSNTTSEFRLFAVDLGATLTLNQVVIKGGDTDASIGGTDHPGAGIYSLGNLNLNQAILEYNSAGSAGAIYILEGTLTTTNGSSIRNNKVVFGSGSGIIVSQNASANITDTYFLYNQMIDPEPAEYMSGALAVFSNAEVVMNYVTVSSNSGAGLGGGISHGSNTSTLSIEHALITGNTAGLTGNAVYIRANGAIHNSCLEGNRGGSYDVDGTGGSASNNWWMPSVSSNSANTLTQETVKNSAISYQPVSTTQPVCGSRVPEYNPNSGGGCGLQASNLGGNSEENVHELDDCGPPPFPTAASTLSPDAYCVSIEVIGVNIRSNHYPTASVSHFVGAPATATTPADPWRLKLIGYIDVPEIGRYYRVAGAYEHGEISALNETIVGWLSEQVTSGPKCDVDEVPHWTDNNLPVLIFNSDPLATYGTATPIPNPPPTPTPPPDLSGVFLLPMQHQNEIRLSRCGLHRDANPSIGRRGDLVLGLDMNPIGGAGASHPLIVPAVSEVVVVDTTIGPGQEIGNFVAIRIAMQNLPPAIKARLDGTTPAENGREIDYNLAPSDGRYQNIPNSSSGAIYIGYGHLATVNSGVTVGATLQAGIEIGTSGATGLDTNGLPIIAPNGQHLHVASFYSPENSRWDLHTWASPVFPDNYNWYFTAYDAGVNHPDIYGASILINPLVLWPSAQEGTPCPYWKILQLEAEGSGG